MGMLGPAMASLLASFALFTWIWRSSVKRSDAGIVDIYWAPGFVLVGLVEASLSFPPTMAGIMILGLTSLWALRLAVHLARRHRASPHEDPRYAAMRAEGGPQWPQESLWRVFLVQATALWAIATPLHAALLPGAEPLSPGLLSLAGGALFVAGFAIEALADAQLARFKRDPAHRGQLFTGGLFGLCRHPNYLGEIAVWWGLALLAWSLTDRPWALIGPALLTFFILKVSGIPPLEKVLATRQGFSDWAARVPAMWPRFRRERLTKVHPRVD